MRGPLGEKIGEGAFSEAYAWAPGQVVKLFKADVSHLLGRHEARMLRSMRAAGLAVPEVFGEVILDGRFGIVMQRLDGSTLLQLSRTGAVSFEQAGGIVAALAISLHKTSLPPEVLSMREYMESELRHDDGKVPKHLATDILALIDRLSPGDRLCHCDLSPGNVIMTTEGPKLVDWTFAMRAPAVVDLGFLHVILSELAPERADNPERPRATNAAAQSEYAQLAGTSLTELMAAMKPYLPVVRTFVVLGDVMPSLRERLIQRIEAGLRSED
ncbi:aminoglycoside phosphotransferase family protein [Bradyrhizobium arachidis]|uniref:aminoglycoside phosphotransferase family protein n=1 Tax=Bradyrhizobium TaxID=374 RepID=UPI0021619D7D|nr:MULTISPECIES: aminoglycoside phosphotransferase family protein [Bradyrhizobium]MDN4988043.1 aminoglycoside phosphotransferase family protein [Bradyrhizobium sp. WYCCWR 13022]UVO35305.1 aminoglycoside phosphotransferase family protein [Bradyrhizobium arachidis]